MCTAIRIGSFAGRNLDVDRSYGAEIIITPKNYAIEFKMEPTLTKHYAIIGMGVVEREYPLYFDAANECGLYAAGLNYVGYAKYGCFREENINLTPYELILYVLAKCRTVTDAERVLAEVNLTDIPFSPDLSTAELHFFIADRHRSIVAEPDQDALHVYDNPTDVLTNNPPFPMQLFNLNNYMSLSPEQPENSFSKSLSFDKYSNGMGAIGLPGDLSSTSRFVRAAFHRANHRGDGLCAIFHLLGSVQMPYGSVRTDVGCERTEYTNAIDLDRQIYTYRHYGSLNAYSIKPSQENLDGTSLIRHKIDKQKEPLFRGVP